MQVDDLVVLGSEIVPCSFQVANLHEEARYNCLSNVDVVVPRVEIGADQLYSKPLRDACL